MPTQPLSRLLVAYDDYTYHVDSTVTGTGWDGSYPVANLTSTQLSNYSSLTGTSGSIAIDLGSSKLIEVLSAIKHTVSTTATWRIRVSDNSLLLTDPDGVPGGQIIYDSTAVSMWPDTTNYTAVPYSEYVSWATNIPNLRNPYALLVLPEDTTAQYIYINIEAEASASIAKLFVGPTWRPLHGVSRNWGIMYKDKKAPVRLKSSVVLTEEIPRYRQLSFLCKYLTDTEAFSHISLLDRYYGIIRPYLAVIDPSDAINDYRLAVYGTNSKLLPMKEAGFEGYFSKTFSIDEWL